LPAAKYVLLEAFGTTPKGKISKHAVYNSMPDIEVAGAFVEVLPKGVCGLVAGAGITIV